MSIEEEQIEHLDNKPPKFKPNLYPVANKQHVSACYHIMCAVAPRGSGKTFSIVKHLKNQEDSGFYDPITGDQVKIKHILFSPTAVSNPVFTALKYLHEDDIHNDYTDEKLFEIVEQIKAERDEIKKFKKYIEAYKKYQRMSDEQIRVCKDYEMLGLLYQYDFKDYKDMDIPEQYVYNIILDDCLANREAFSAKKANTLTRMILNSRHIAVNCILASQNLKSIPKIIRNNTDIWVLFKCKNEKVLMDDLYPEISALYSPEEFLTYYNYATSASDHDALVYDGKEPKKEDRMKLNFDVILRLKK
jgi:hypothetical protein